MHSSCTVISRRKPEVIELHHILYKCFNSNKKKFLCMDQKFNMADFKMLSFVLISWKSPYCTIMHIGWYFTKFVFRWPVRSDDWNFQILFSGIYHDIYRTTNSTNKVCFANALSIQNLRHTSICDIIIYGYI
jgi:hypothetical protein